MEPKFLTLGEVEELHSVSLAEHGGMAGTRDSGLVQNTWWYGHGDLFDVAAAYAYHLAESQAFFDGNKRTAILAAIVFLAGNGEKIPRNDDTLYQAMIDIANHRLDKAGLAAVFRRLAAQ
jgi:death on curing protein